ncbi:MAG: EAL domain-containing protein [Oscillospiraceae bacterium]|jgi:lactose/cellobiose-specific phosphotransferase system IIC component|nr:EAL domain-containing protein [Oscillospiraceae bacterium]
MRPKKPFAQALLYRLSNQRHLYAVKGGFVSLIPLMILGSFAVLVNNLPIQAYQRVMVSLLGADWKAFGGHIYAATFSIVALAAVMSISGSLSSWYRQHKGVNLSPIQAALVALCAFLIMGLETDGLIVTRLSGTTGLFSAIFVGLLSTELLVHLMQHQPRRLRLFFDEPDYRIARVFHALLPSLVTVLCFGVLRAVFGALGLPTLHELIYAGLQAPFRGLSDTPLTALLFNVISHVMWLFGIHGNNVLDHVAQNVLVPALHVNAAAAVAGHMPTQVFTKTFFDAFVYMGGSGATLCLIGALLLFARRSGQDRLARISILPGLFNINELLIFGLPVIINPIYAIPFILAPLCMMGLAAAATLLHLVPYTTVEVAWTTPILVSGYLATGHWSGVALQIVNLAAGILVYRPFVLQSERMKARQFAEAYDKLRHLCEEDYDMAVGVKYLQREDDVGGVARLLAMDLRRALDKEDELYYLYQPCVTPSTGTVQGAEELLRWKHPVYGPISPMVVVALAEDMGIVHELGRKAIESACRTLKRWRAAGLPDSLFISVNISVTELKEPGFADRIAQIAADHDVPPSGLEIEITETLAVSNEETTSRNLLDLRAHGFGIAIDDFGMGHSSLVYLKRFPISTLKVDKCLSKDVTTAPENLEIISSILQLCQTLNIGLVVEYVENEDQLRLLDSIGCTHFQGYHFSRPISDEAFCLFVREIEVGPEHEIL